MPGTSHLRPCLFPLLRTAGRDWGSHPVGGGLTIGCGQVGVGGAAVWLVQLFLQGKAGIGGGQWLQEALGTWPRDWEYMGFWLPPTWA